MVTAVSSFDPLAFISQTQNTAPAGSGSSSSSASPSGTNASSSLPTDGLSSSLLSLVEGVGNTSSNGNLISTLFGGAVSSSDPLAGVYSTLLYNSSTVQPLAQAIANTQQQQAQNQTRANPLNNVLTSYTSALNAYNQTLLQNAQSVLDGNSALTPPLVA